MTRMSPQNIERHIRALTEEIGVRLAGSAQEKQAADYVADQFEHPSLPGPHPRDPT
ncbi:MAG: hypothetical protein GY809_16305, partial [Planctomycetes bacterium]|nr:hypothetical protein [Planctomycetota bacterium]